MSSKAQPISSRARVHTIYRLKDGTRVPGVTTILNELSKPALIYWAWDLGIQQIDYRTYRDELADVGTLAHQMVLWHLRGETWDTSEYSPLVRDKAENAFLSYLEWERQHEIEPILIEVPLVSEKFRYGGTMDFYGRINGELTLMDFKTGKGIYDNYFYQMAGYWALLEEHGHKVESCRILRIGRDETEGFEEAQRKDLDLEDSIFFHTLEIYVAKRQIKKRGK